MATRHLSKRRSGSRATQWAPAIALALLASLARAADPPEPAPDDHGGVVSRTEKVTTTSADGARQTTTTTDIIVEATTNAPSTTAPAPPATTKLATTVAATRLLSTTQPALLPWLNNLATAVDNAQQQKQPILVDVGAEWCGWCKKLDQEIALPAVQGTLARWTRVKLDADKDTDAARKLAVGPIPALRILTPLGRTVATHDGYLRGEQLTAWLDKYYQQAAGGAEVGAEPTDAASVQALVARLTDGDAVVRETATRRLMRHPSVAAVGVVEAFAGGKLAARLAAMELLVEWKAPVQGLDPWEPATITPQRLEELKHWAEARSKAPPTTQSTQGAVTGALSPEELTAARRDIATLLAATTGSEARAARERLARSGTALLPEVHAALQNAASDRDRERLTALRYRLSASDDLALSWPEGFDRLAAPDAAVRHKAVDELSTRTHAQDAPLLLELFSDPDPLVRETSLRMLQSMGSSGTTEGLVKLLHDPEPNVRAAVLKQLAESPVPGMEPEIIRYVTTEKDPDLVVHAVRVLRESKTKSKAVVDALTGLLGSESWRVRAEAVEALGKAVGYEAPAERKADVYASMIKLLNDPDGFMVGRAVMVLRDANVPAAVDPLVAVAEKRPELAGDVIRALTRGTPDANAIAHLRKFCAHPDAAVRAAAITGLAGAVPGDAGAELRAALGDASSSVRLAAARALVSALERQRPDPNEEIRSGIFKTTRKKRDMEKWLDEFRAGKARAEWLAPLVAPLEQMVAGTAPNAAPAEERLAAAVPLVALGKDDRALPVLQSAAKADPAQRRIAAEALPWLPVAQRKALFSELLSGAPHEELGRYVRELAEIPGQLTIDSLWEVLAQPGADANLAAQVNQLLLAAYFGERYYDPSSVPADRLAAATQVAKEKLKSGPEAQRLAALAMLIDASPRDAVAPAEELIKQLPAGNLLRADAFAAVLLGKSAATGAAQDGLRGMLREGSPEAKAAAVAALDPATARADPAAAADTEMKKVAIRYLCFDTSGLRQLHDAIYLSLPSMSGSYSSGQAIVVPAPSGLKPEWIRPMLKDTDLANAANAGYLLCLMGERAGLDPLVAYWRSTERRGSEQTTLVYRAVAALNDDSLVPILDEVYGTFEKRDYAIREFYWTIRPMNGPNVLKLRKKIRDDVGMDRLR